MEQNVSILTFMIVSGSESVKFPSGASQCILYTRTFLHASYGKTDGPIIVNAMCPRHSGKRSGARRHFLSARSLYSRSQVYVCATAMQKYASPILRGCLSESTCTTRTRALKYVDVDLRPGYRFPRSQNVSTCGPAIIEQQSGHFLEIRLHLAGLRLLCDR